MHLWTVLSKHHHHSLSPGIEPTTNEFQLRRFSVIKLGRVRFKVKDVVWGAAVAGGGTLDMLKDQ